MPEESDCDSLAPCKWLCHTCSSAAGRMENTNLPVQMAFPASSGSDTQVRIHIVEKIVLLRDVTTSGTASLHLSYGCNAKKFHSVGQN